jgi:hypothetical protein
MGVSEGLHTGCQNDVVVSQVIPAYLFVLSVNQITAQPMRAIDFMLDFALPLTDECDRANNKCSLPEVRFQIWRTRIFHGS